TTEEVRSANGDNVPLWVTETGMSTQQFTQAQQALVDGFVLYPLMGDPGIAGVYINMLVEPKTGGQGRRVVDSDLSPRPAYCMMAKVMATSYSCPLTVAQPNPSSTQMYRWQAELLVQAAAEAAITYYAAHGTYSSLTSAGLHALDSRISATPAP